MKHIFYMIILSFGINNLYAQETLNAPEEEEGFIGSYYNEQFKPFAKGNGFVGLAFSLADEKSDNSKDILKFDRTITSKSLDYSVKFKGGYFIAKNSMVGLGYNIE